MASPPPGRTSDAEQQRAGVLGPAGVPDGVDALVLLPHVLQHQVAQGVELPPLVQHAAAPQQHHLRRGVGLGAEHHLPVRHGHGEVDVLPEERRLALLPDGRGGGWWTDREVDGWMDG